MPFVDDTAGADKAYRILRTMSGDDNDGTFDPGLSWTSDESDSDLDEDEDVMMDQG